MKLEIFHVDAFASGPFTGNPAAVVPLEQWLSDALLQSIAAENNLSETAFFVGNAGTYELRWFTPTTEVDLCGHATLAAGHVILREQGAARDSVRFHTREAGELIVNRDGARLALDFPARPARRIDDPAQIKAVAEALRTEVRELWAARDWLAIVRDEDTVRRLQPDIAKIAALDFFALTVSARGSDCDFVSRFFAPRQGIAEDPVTGSAHCTLVPYWSNILGKTELRARQLSARGGELLCRLGGDRAHIAGHAVTYLRGTIEIPDPPVPA